MAINDYLSPKVPFKLGQLLGKLMKKSQPNVPIVREQSIRLFESNVFSLVSLVPSFSLFVSFTLSISLSCTIHAAIYKNAGPRFFKIF